MTDEPITPYLAEVPPSHQPYFLLLAALTDNFCEDRLDEEYRSICRAMAVDLCQEDCPPKRRGKPASWACGIVYAAGWVNFLTDKTSEPHLRAEEIAAGFGVSTATMYNKFRAVRDELQLEPYDEDYSTDATDADLREMRIWQMKTLAASAGIDLEVTVLPIDTRTATREEVHTAMVEAGWTPTDDPPGGWIPPGETDDGASPKAR